MLYAVLQFKQQLFVPFLSFVALKDEIAAANEKFMAAFKAQDANAVAALYTEDCKVMPPGTDVVMGRDGIQLVCDWACKTDHIHIYTYLHIKL